MFLECFRAIAYINVSKHLNFSSVTPIPTMLLENTELSCTWRTLPTANILTLSADRPTHRFELSWMLIAIIGYLTIGIYKAQLADFADIIT